MKIISVCSEKGGVGKTTSTVNSAIQLAKTGSKVLVVDLDGQANASRFLGYIRDGKPTSAELIYNVIAGMDIDIDEIIRKSNYENLDYIPASQMLTNITTFMANDFDSNYILQRIFTNEYFVENYDYILFDCRTLLDLLVSNALTSSDFVIIPVESGIFSFDGLEKMLDKVKGISSTTNTNLKVLGILLNKQNKTVVSESIVESVREEYGDMVFNVIIPYCPAQSESNVLGNAKNGSFDTAFYNLAREIEYRIGKETPNNDDTADTKEIIQNINDIF